MKGLGYPRDRNARHKRRRGEEGGGRRGESLLCVTNNRRCDYNGERTNGIHTAVVYIHLICGVTTTTASSNTFETHIQQEKSTRALGAFDVDGMMRNRHGLQTCLMLTGMMNSSMRTTQQHMVNDS